MLSKLATLASFVVTLASHLVMPANAGIHDFSSSGAAK